jgi:hypothetical protein
LKNPTMAPDVMSPRAGTEVQWGHTGVVAASYYHARSWP